VPRQPTEVTGLAVRTRHVGLTAAVINAAKLLNWLLPGQEHVDFHEDNVMFGEVQDVQPLEQALRVLEPHFQNLRQGNVAAHLYNLLSPNKKARQKSNTPRRNRRLRSSRSKRRRICTYLLVRRTSSSRIGVKTQGLFGSAPHNFASASVTSGCCAHCHSGAPVATWGALGHRHRRRLDAHR
jgi:hypothetical protein